MNESFNNFLATLESIGFRLGNTWEDGNKQTYFYSSFFQDLMIELPIKPEENRIKINVSRSYKNYKESTLDKTNLYNGFANIEQPYDFLIMLSNIFPQDFIKSTSFQAALTNHSIKR